MIPSSTLEYELDFDDEFDYKILKEQSPVTAKKDSFCEGGPGAESLPE